MIGRPANNGRYGGGNAGKEHRYKMPAVDAQRFDQATATMTPGSKLQGESARVVGSDANTMAGGRGVTVGTQIDTANAFKGFKK